MSEVEQFLVQFGSGLKLVIEMSSVTIVGIGLVAALYLLISTLVTKQKLKYIRLRLLLGRFLVIALEFQLAADIVGTAIAPSWEQIGKLGAIALIRTFLNHFLNREIKTEEEQQLEELRKENKKPQTLP